jgi:hypothetical protein
MLTAVVLSAITVSPVSAPSSGLAGHRLALPGARLVGTDGIAMVIDIPPVIVGNPDPIGVLGPRLRRRGRGRVCASGEGKNSGENSCGELHFNDV